jgi:hypothetical protein
MSDQLDANKKYEFAKINDLVFNMNKYQKILNNKKTDTGELNKYKKKIQKCVDKLKKLGINMDPAKTSDQTGGSTSVRYDGKIIEKITDDMAYELCKEHIFMDNICR